VAEKVCWRAGWSKAAKPELVYLAGVYHDIGKVVVAIPRNSAQSTRRSACATSYPAGFLIVWLVPEPLGDVDDRATQVSQTRR
jgi:hypothetical protein